MPSLPLTSVEIARLEEARIAVAFATIFPQHERLAGGVMAADKPGMWGNCAVGLGMNGEVSDAEVQRLIRFYADRGAEPRIDVCPFSHSSLIENLAKHGFVVRLFNNVMACDLAGDRQDAGNNPVVIDGKPLRIEHVDRSDRERVRLHAKVTMTGFMPPGTDISESQFDLAFRIADLPGYHLHLAFCGDTPVGSSGLEMQDRGATLFGASTLAPYRRRGVQQALIRARLDHARELGARVATIRSKPGIATERNAARTGFAMAYTSVCLVRPGPGLAPVA